MFFNLKGCEQIYLVRIIKANELKRKEGGYR